MKKIIKNCIIILSIIITSVFFISLNSYTIARDPNSSKGFAEFDDEAAAQETQELVQQQEEQANQQNTTNGDRPEETTDDVENDNLLDTDTQVQNEINETNNSVQSSAEIEENKNKFSIDADLLIFITIIAIIVIILLITVIARKSNKKK